MASCCGSRSISSATRSRPRPLSGRRAEPRRPRPRSPRRRPPLPAVPGRRRRACSRAGSTVRMRPSGWRWRSLRPDGALPALRRGLCERRLPPPSRPISAPSKRSGTRRRRHTGRSSPGWRAARRAPKRLPASGRSCRSARSTRRHWPASTSPATGRSGSGPAGAFRSWRSPGGAGSTAGRATTSLSCSRTSSPRWRGWRAFSTACSWRPLTRAARLASRGRPKRSKGGSAARPSRAAFWLRFPSSSASSTCCSTAARTSARCR